MAWVRIPEDVRKYIVPSCHWSTLNSHSAASPLVRLVEGEERTNFKQFNFKLENRFAKLNCTTTEQMIRMATLVCFQDDEIKNMCATLEESVPSQVEKVISAKTRLISY
ncbi:hypothetical protein TNCV_4030731 [Trichonephila clavipes]|nr:hypothetical protein TNCV_4030731 [Trichonephila clavipes]